MKFRLILAAALLCPGFTLGGGLPPEAVVNARHLMEQALEENSAYAIVESLTTEVGPRLAGTEAEARARRWAVTKLKALGFSNVRIEPFEVPLWLRGEERAELLAPYPQSLVITTLGGSTSTGPEGVSGEVAAFGSLAELDNVAAGSLGGKIVFVNEGMTRTQDGLGYGVAVQKRLKVATSAKQAGASAALIRSVGTDHNRLAHTGQIGLIDYESDMGVPAAALAAPDADQLQRMLDRADAVTLKLVLTPQTLPPVVSGNVIAEIPGSVTPAEVVLMGAPGFLGPGHRCHRRRGWGGYRGGRWPTVVGKTSAQAAADHSRGVIRC